MEQRENARDEKDPPGDGIDAIISTEHKSPMLPLLEP